MAEIQANWSCPVRVMERYPWLNFLFNQKMPSIKKKTKRKHHKEF
jgi:hypothetical protein